MTGESVAYRESDFYGAVRRYFFVQYARASNVARAAWWSGISNEDLLDFVQAHGVARPVIQLRGPR